MPTFCIFRKPKFAENRSDCLVRKTRDEKRRRISLPRSFSHSSPTQHLSLSLCSLLSLLPIPSNAVLRHKRRTQSRQREEIERWRGIAILPIDWIEKKKTFTWGRGDRRLGCWAWDYVRLRDCECFYPWVCYSSWKVIFPQQTQWKEVSKLVFALLTLSWESDVRNVEL